MNFVSKLVGMFRKSKRVNARAAQRSHRNSRKRSLFMEGLENRKVMAAGDLLISEVMANPSGVDINTEYVELVATRPINFATNNYSVIWTRNGNATVSGWTEGTVTTFGINLTSGSVSAGDIIYVGGLNISNTGAVVRKIDTAGFSGGDDSLGFGSPIGVLDDGGADADGVAVYDVRISSVTAATVPIDAVFFGSARGGAVLDASNGYQLPVNDRYTGGKYLGSSFLAANAVEGQALIATGSYVPSTNNYPISRSWVNGAATNNSTAINLLTNPVNSTISYASDTSFTISTTGSPAPAIQWQVSTNGGGSWSNLSNGGVYGGVTTNTLSLTLPPVSLSNNQYRAQTTNAAGSGSTAGATLTVNPIAVDVKLNGVVGGQRSQVTSLTVTFPSPVPLSLGDLQLTKLHNLDLTGVATPVTSMILTTVSPTQYTITFGAGTSVITRGALGGGNSLADGNYRLTMVPNGNYQYGALHSDKFFRMFGDSDGDGDVDGTDTVAFRRAVVAYNAAMDWDGNGSVTGGSSDSTNFAANSSKKRRLF
jgi:hypothetical protein